MNAPFLVRREEVQHDFRIAIAVFAEHHVGGFQVYRRTIDAEAFAEFAHPLVVLVKLLATGECAPRNQLVYVGVAGVVGYFFGLQPRPNR